MPDFVLFSHGYSKPRCSLNFPASSQWTHCSSISSLFTLWPHYHLISVPGLLLDYRVSNAPVMLLLSAESSEILTPFPALYLWSAAHVLLLGQSFSAPSPASYFVSHLPAKVSLLSSVPYSCNFQPPTVFHFFNLCSKTLLGLFRYQAFQVLNEVAHKSGEFKV